MLLPDNMQPELSIYYNGALVLKELKEMGSLSVMALYQSVKNKMSFPIFILCLDWLYLIDVAQINERGDIELCL
ncbi:ABC-three component system middle component 6 [Lachnospiraceae bacterium 46-61]